MTDGRGWGRMSLAQSAMAGIGADVVLALAALAAVPILVRGLGTEAYGVLGVISVLGGQLGLLHLGVGTAASRVVAEAHARDGDGRVTRGVNASTLVGIGSSFLVAGVFAALAGPAWRHLFTLSDAGRLAALSTLVPATLFVGLTPLASALHGVLRGRGLFGPLAAIRVTQGTVRLAAAVVVVLRGGGVTDVLWAQVAVDGVAVLAAFSVGRSGLRSAAADGSLADGVRATLRIGLPLAVAGLFVPLLLDADKLLVGAGLSVNDLTYYLVPYNAVFRLTALAGAAEAVLTARLALAGTEGRAEAAWVVARTTPVLALVVAGVAAPLAAGMPELLDLWLGEDFALRSSLPAGILLVGITANAVAMPSHSTILGRMDTRVLPAVYGVETVLYVAVLYLLVGWLGLTGAAVAWSLRMVGDAAVQQSLAARSAPLGRRATLVGWGAVASVLGVVMLITGPLAGSALTRWTVGVSAGAAAFTALAAMPEGRLLARSLLRRPGGRS